MVEVLSDGSVRNVRVLESSGHAVLDRSALKAVQKWRFRPGTRGGKPVTMNVKVPVVFRLTRDGKG
jgi:protein TonB